MKGGKEGEFIKLFSEKVEERKFLRG